MAESSPTPVPRTRKAVSPYDSLGVSITSVVLRGENYEQWSRAVRCALRARRKFGFVDGTIKELEVTSAEREDWVQVSSLVASWVYNSLNEKLQNQVTYTENAHLLWVDLEHRFNLTNGPRVHRIKKAIAHCQQNGDSVMNYYGRLKKLWDDLATFKQNPTCSCDGCECGITAKLDKEKEEKKLHQFLMGLDDTIYKTVRSNILGLDPLPNVNQAYQRVIQEEQLIEITREDETRVEAVGFAVKAPVISEKKMVPLSEVTCNFCKRTGHEEINCFHKHGFPEWWKDRSRGRGRGGSSRLQGRGRGQSQFTRANVTAVGETNGGNMTSSLSPGVTPEQWRAIQMALQTTMDSSTETLSGPQYKDSDWSG